MKTFLVTVTIALAGVSSTQAQIFRPSVGSGAVVGAVAGGLIGGHNGDRWAEGAVIGAAAGALIGAALTPQPAYQPPPVYQAYPGQNYGQQVYGQPTTVVTTAPVVPNAPMVPSAPVYVEQSAPQFVQAPPQVVYVERQPQVVYVPAAPPPAVYVRPPVFSFGFGYYSGPRHYSRPVYHHGYHHRGHHNPHHYRGHHRGRW